MYVIGTAGHVDHGKSTLVKALTGMDPDRLREEKEREMSIVLGFAWLTLPGGERVGIVDVPGHRDFIKNMLAGVGGIDAALLVIAADEGIMPQTREHLAILDLLQVRGGVIALTKVDLVDEEWLELVTADVMEQVEGTCMDRVPIVPVSAVTGQGLETLVATLESCLKGVPPRADRGRPRLPIDRVFTIAGFGVVVTGTLVDGSLAVGEEVEILPSERRARIRGLQTYKEKVEQAVPGSRVAVNLGGVSKDDIQVGEVVTWPGLMKSTQLIDVQLRYLADAPRPLVHDAEVDLFCGAAEVPAHVRLLGVDQLEPGEVGWAQLRLSHPVAVARSDRFILRWLSPSVTVGGGVVVDPAPRRRHRRFHPEVMARLETLAFGSPAEIVLQVLGQEQPCEARELFNKIALPAEIVHEALARLLGQGSVLVLDDFVQPVAGWLESSAAFVISSAGWHDLVERTLAILNAYHDAWPLRKGMPREELRSRLQESSPNLTGRLFNQVIDRARHEGHVQDDPSSIWVADHTVRFTPEQQEKAVALLNAFRQAPFATPSVAECEERVGAEELNALVENGTLVRLSADVVFLSETFAQVEKRIVEHIRREGQITVAQVRDIFNSSRKYALAMVEYLDEKRITRRVGDVRVLR